MRKLLLSTLIIAAAAMVNTAHAQYSIGGTPYSFTNSVKSIQTVNFNVMPPVDLDELRKEDAINDPNKGPFRFGFNHYVNFNLNNSGKWTTLANGDRIWQLGVKSPGALTINLAFDDFYMPEGASTFIYNETKDFVIGAFTKMNNDKSKMFATDLIAGDAIVIEYYEPKAVVGQGRINLFRATHGYRGVMDFAEKTFGASGSCEINVNCPLGTNWQNEKKGVVCLVVNGGEFCSGSLVNDVPQDKKPFVLTANHCSTSNDWASWVFRFNWEAPTCTNPSSSPSTAQSLNTSTLCARNSPSDFCLVEITGGLQNGTVPASYQTYFNGWSNSPTAATSAIGIHHPSGDIKKISEAANACVSVAWSGSVTDHWQVGLWTSGCTEPGSSGSPLFDQNHRIVGQLHGGPSACGNTGTNMVDSYGKFAVSWLGGGTNSTQLKYWLDSANTGAVTVNGFDPNSSVGVAQTADITLSFNVYPNPSNGVFNLEVTLPASQNVSINILNILGETVSTKTYTNMSNGVYSIDLSKESKGLYFAEIISASGKTVKKLSLVK
jgi:lysyl endopeptidase